MPPPSRPEVLRACADALRSEGSHTHRGRRVLWIGLALGAVVFTVAIGAGGAARAWRAYLVNFLFWGTLAQGSVLFAALLTLTGGRWGMPLVRLAQSGFGFVPVGVVLTAALGLGGAHVMPWADAVPAHLGEWLSPGAVLLRQIGVWLVLALAGGVYVRRSLRRDLGELQEAYPELVSDRVSRWLTRGWRGADAERPRARRGVARAAAAVAASSALGISLLAFDWVMPLDPHWRSALLGGHVLVGGLYAAIAALTLWATTAASHLGVAGRIGTRQLHDLGKLLLGFAMLTTYFFFSQLLPIWYANLPVETRFLMPRLWGPWRSAAVVVLVLAYLGPIAVLLSRRVKRSAAPLAAVAATALVGMAGERTLFVAPSLPVGSGFGAGWVELGVTLAFASGYALLAVGFLRRVPPLPVGDQMLYEAPGEWP